MLPQRLSYRRVVVIGERLDLLRSKKPDELRGPDAALRVELQRSRRPVSSKATGFQSINKAGFLAVSFFFVTGSVWHDFRPDVHVLLLGRGVHL